MLWPIHSKGYACLHPCIQRTRQVAHLRLNWGTCIDRHRWITRRNIRTGHFFHEFDVVAAVLCDRVKHLLCHLRRDNGSAADLVAACAAFTDELPLLGYLPARKA
jgi:hypothetical protein